MRNKAGSTQQPEYLTKSLQAACSGKRMRGFRSASLPEALLLYMLDSATRCRLPRCKLPRNAPSTQKAPAQGLLVRSTASAGLWLSITAPCRTAYSTRSSVSLPRVGPPARGSDWKAATQLPTHATPAYTCNPIHHLPRVGQHDELLKL